MILINAGQIATDTLARQPDALIEAFYPAFGAPALARQIFGITNKWGRLPYVQRYTTPLMFHTPLLSFPQAHMHTRTHTHTHRLFVFFLLTD